MRKRILVESNVIEDGRIVGSKRTYMKLSSMTYEELYELLYKKSCSEQYCYPKVDTKVVAKAHKVAYNDFIRNGGMILYARYNRMD